MTAANPKLAYSLQAELYGRSRYEGTHQPLIAEPRAYAQLIEVRAAPRAVLVLVRDGNRLHLIEAARSDEPTLDVLAPSDRARVASAVHAWARDSQEGANDANR